MSTRSQPLRSLVALALLSAILSPAAESLGARQSSIVAIPTLGGGISIGRGVNPGGVLAGSAETAAFTEHAITWQDRNRNRISDPDETLDLGTLGGPESRAFSINAAGQVVGESQVLLLFTHAFFFQDRNRNRAANPGEMIDLGTLGGASSTASDINTKGQAVGYSEAPGGFDHAFFWQDRNRNRVSDPGDMFDIGTLPGGTFSQAFALNNTGQVVGMSDRQDGKLRAFVWQDRNRNRAANPGEMIDLGTLGGEASQANDINQAGLVVGSTNRQDGATRAFLWQDRNRNRVSDTGEMIDLGTLGGEDSTAAAINGSGEVVGLTDNAEGASRGFYWKDKNRNRRTDAGEMVDLLSLLPVNSGWTYLDPVGLNDRGQVTGVGLFNGAQRAFLLNLR